MMPSKMKVSYVETEEKGKFVHELLEKAILFFGNKYTAIVTLNNLQAKTNRLDHEALKQQEVLYHQVDRWKFCVFL